MHAGPVRQPRVRVRNGVVEPTSARRDEALGQPAQRGLVGDDQVSALHPVAAIHPHRPGTVHEDVADGGVA